MILRRAEWKRISVDLGRARPDAAGALGAALLIGKLQLGKAVRVPYHNAFLGSQFCSGRGEPAELRAALPRLPLAPQADSVVRSLMEGRSVIRFHGRMESGLRALGGAAIWPICRPSFLNRNVKRTIKEREDFHPLATGLLDSAPVSGREHPLRD